MKRKPERIKVQQHEKYQCPDCDCQLVETVLGPRFIVCPDCDCVIAVDVVKRICDDQSDLITALESTIRDHEEDSAALPEDMSITETIKMKDKRIDTLTRDLAIHKRALELAITISEYNLECPRELDGDSNCGKIYFDPDTQECSLPEDKWIYCWIDKFITEATAEIDKEATDD